MNSLALLVKPSSSLCNLHCKYCFYKDVSENRSRKQTGFMEDATAEHIISEAFRTVSPGGNITFMFQGGEPTLVGLNFFKSFLSLEKKYSSKSISCEHAIQTNGFDITEEWATFFKEHGFLVGLSLDGTQFLHDNYRTDAKGRGTWSKVIQALELLDSFDVETNILCVVTGQSAKKASQIYRALALLGRHPLQFIPCLDPLNTQRGINSFSLKPDHYGRFLCSLFDCWYSDWKDGNYVSIRNFDDYIRILLRLPPSSCAAGGQCGSYLVIEADGSMYPCDFYATDEWYLGNISSLPIKEALSSDISSEFISESALCRNDRINCRYMPLCMGGCKRDRLENGANYYCDAFKSFFRYSLPRLEEMAAAYRRDVL